jgi:acyl carrier protein
MRLKQVILEFLGNEFQLESHAISGDTTFVELGVSSSGMPDLLHRLQDALGIILPEDQTAGIETVDDLLDLIDEEEPEA